MHPEELQYRLWAKTNERDRDFVEENWTRHPLPLHLLDVGHVTESWLEADEQLFTRFCQLWPEADPIDVRRGLVLAAAVHDLGKAHPDFQAKSEKGWAYGYGLEWEGAIPSGRGFDHGAGTERIFRALFGRRYGAPKGDPAWKSLLPVIRVGAGHHGTLYPDDALPSDVAARGSKRLPVLIALLNELVYHFGPLPELPPTPPNAFLLLAAGLVSVSDWFGSNTDYFPACPDVDGRKSATAYLAAHRQTGTGTNAIRDAGLLTSLNPPTEFADLFGEPGNRWNPRPGFQAAACAVPFGTQPGPEIAVIEAPMGLGKTEIALHLSAKSIRARNSSGLYFALPTQATSNALFGRIVQFAERIKGDEDLAVVLAHGAKSYFREYRSLCERTGRYPWNQARRAERGDPNPPSEIIAPSWMQPAKRALLAPIGLGTIDQALLGGVGVKHCFVRLFGLARKVVILDEIHAYDVYMGALLGHLLAWLGALGAKVILLSATLPLSLKARLLEAYGVSDIPNADGYPQLMHASGFEHATVLLDPDPGSARQSKVEVQALEASGDSAARTEVGGAWIEESLAHGGCIAWIRNTVKEAQDAYELLRARGIAVDLLHARFARNDRNENEEALLKRFGQPAPVNSHRPAKRVVVATQVIEQSVDVDFDAMLSDLAPVDLLLQRAGRLWRHDRGGHRHEHEAPHLCVLMPDADGRKNLDFGGSAYVYDADILARSAVLVLENPEWALPAACRDLVAILYDHDESYWTAKRLMVDSDKLDKARERLAVQQRRMQQAARRIFLSSPDQFPVMRDARNDRSESGGNTALVTRYGIHTASVVLFHLTVDGPATVGRTNGPVRPPADGDWPGRLELDEVIALATVSFPWYGPRPTEIEPPSSLAELHQWWTETHPYDDRVFVLLGDDDSFENEYIAGRYSKETGLMVTRRKKAASDSIPLEDL